MGHHGRPIKEADPDASKLNFGEEFANAQFVTVSEVCALLEAQEQKKDAHLDNKRDGLDKVFNYVRTFSRFNREAVLEVRKLFMDTLLEQYEIVQLANLCCEEADEAKSLIPSLAHKIDDDELKKLLDHMLTIKKFQG